jgi:hypothetical protein
MVKMVAQVSPTVSTVAQDIFLKIFAGYHYDHKVRIYKEYHSVCPRVEIGILPLSPASVPLPPEPGGGGHTHSLRVRGWGSPNSDDWIKSLALCLVCGYDLA